VLFTIFYNALNGMRYSAGDVCLFFLAAAVGSVLLGLVIGVVALRWLRTANRPLKDMDITAQIAITICCSYLVFFTAQYFLRISGVLACCGAGD
jgi:NhaP-type Na+/H+ or K+/H+ antiporter